MIIQERLKELLHYDSETGLFTWLIATAQRIKVGDIAGSINSNGYIIIRIDSKNYRAHRLAFLYMTGKFPENDADHKDTNRTNNKWENLREATRSQNMMNGTKRKDNNSGFKGVGFHKLTGLWRARINLDKEEIYLGSFSTPELAHDAYTKAANEKFNIFARVNG